MNQRSRCKSGLTKEVSVRLGSYPGDGEGDRPIEASGTEVRFGRASECMGRNASEDPAWILSERDTTTFLRMLEGLPEAPSRVFADNLGYRGFSVSVNGVDAGPLDIKVYNGVIGHTAGTTVRYFTDTGRRVERWLLTTAKPHVAPDLYQLIEKEVGPAPGL